MKTNKLVLRNFIYLAFILCLYAKFLLQPSQSTQTGSTTVLLISTDLCCSFKLEKLTNSLAISVTIGG
jgi:hypothetical protein